MYWFELQSEGSGRRNEFESGGWGPVLSESGAKRRTVFWSCPSTFLALKVQLVVLVSAFVMVSTVWSVSSLLFLYSRCSSVPSHL